MSNTPEDNAVIEEAKADFVAYHDNFQKKYGYSIGFEVTPAITNEGYIKLENVIKLVKLEEQANTPSNGDTETKETSASDSSERAEA